MGARARRWRQRRTGPPPNLLPSSRPCVWSDRCVAGHDSAALRERHPRLRWRAGRSGGGMHPVGRKKLRVVAVAWTTPPFCKPSLNVAVVLCSCDTGGAAVTVSRLINRNVVAARGRTSMRLEPELWDALLEICERENQDMSTLVRQVEQAGHEGGRTSAVRVFVLDYFRAAATEQGHAMAGHGTLPR